MLRIPVRENVKIAVYDPNPLSATAPCARKTILMVHGWPLSAKMYEYQQRWLVNNGYRAITLDLRGFGQSDAPGWGYDYDTLAGDLYRVICRMNLRNITLVGFSMGGAVALRYMRLYRGFGVQKLALLAAAAPRFTRTEDFPYGQTWEQAEDLVQQAKTDRAQLAQDFSRMLLYSPHSEAIKDWFRDIALGASGIGTVRTAISLQDEDCRDDLYSIKVPTGIFHGKQDVVVPYIMGEIQHEAIPGSRLYSFENSGHGVFYDELPQFNRCFLEFLRQ